MAAVISEAKILVISTFPPKKCGIASFASDLINAVNFKTVPETTVEVCALDKKNNSAKYHYPVSIVMDGHRLDACIDSAISINKDDAVKLICIEHEFGLYGGEL